MMALSLPSQALTLTKMDAMLKATDPSDVGRCTVLNYMIKNACHGNRGAQEFLLDHDEITLRNSGPPKRAE